MHKACEICHENLNKNSIKIIHTFLVNQSVRKREHKFLVTFTQIVTDCLALLFHKIKSACLCKSSARAVL